jgi:hypothetical protein
MWRVTGFTGYLESYCQSKYINRIFLVNNDRKRTPKADILKHQKISIIDYGRNIYVNPAWNEGYYRSLADILCLLSDDVNVHDDIFKLISQHDFSSTDLIGSALTSGKDNYHIGQYKDSTDKIIPIDVNRSTPIGGQAWAFGTCMFIKRSSYKVIPSLYQIWFGDDYLVQTCRNISVIKTNKIEGEVSKTLVDLANNGDLHRRMTLDALNVYNFNHFKNGKHWSVIKDTINARTRFELRK